MTRIFLAVALIAVLTARAFAAPTTTDGLASDLGLDPKVLADLAAGKMVQLSPPEMGERDLAVAFVFHLPGTPKELADSVLRSAGLATDPAIVSTHRLHSEADLESLRLAPKGDAEAKHYLAAEPGDQLNLSEEEIAALRALPPGTPTAQVEAQVRRLLAARLKAYRERGLEGMAPYARDKGRGLSPANELRRIAAQMPLLDKHAPGVRELLLGYPKVRPEHLEEAYHGLVYRLDDRPTIVLRHLMSAAVGPGYLVSDREFYVSQGHNATQAVTGLLPAPGGGTMVFYVTHTSTDRVSGFAASTKHAIGRRMFGKAVAGIFEKARKQRR